MKLDASTGTDGGGWFGRTVVTPGVMTYDHRCYDLRPKGRDEIAATGFGSATVVLWRNWWSRWLDGIRCSFPI